MNRVVIVSALLVGCGMKRPVPISAPSAMTPAERPLGTEVQLAVTGELVLQTKNLDEVADELRERTQEAGGHVIADTVHGAGLRQASLVLRLPPDQVDPVTAWVSEQGRVLERSFDAEDVGGEIRDVELRLRTLQTTLARLEALLVDQTELLSDVLEVEREITRVREEIERLQWEQHFLDDRVAWARITVVLHETAPERFDPSAKFHPGVQGRALVFVGDQAPPVQLGVGAVVHINRAFTMDIAVLDADEGPATVLGSAGVAAYSEFMGDGERRFGNPWLGARVGGAWLDERAWWVLAVDAGVELWRTRGLLVEVHARPTALIAGDVVRPALDAGLGLIVPF